MMGKNKGGLRGFDETMISFLYSLYSALHPGASVAIKYPSNVLVPP